MVLQTAHSTMECILLLALYKTLPESKTLESAKPLLLVVAGAAGAAGRMCSNK